MNKISNINELRRLTQANLAIIESIHKIRDSKKDRTSLVPESRLLDDLVYASEMLTSSILWSAHKISGFDSRGHLDSIIDDIEYVDSMTEKPTEGNKGRLSGLLDRLDERLSKLPNNA